MRGNGSRNVGSTGIVPPRQGEANRAVPRQWRVHPYRIPNFRRRFEGIDVSARGYRLRVAAGAVDDTLITLEM
jgi:hypothetical protein